MLNVEITESVGKVPYIVPVIGVRSEPEEGMYQRFLASYPLI
jgi:hypothetical protein